MRKQNTFPKTLWRVGWRYLIRSPWQSLLMIFGIMLGVAVVVGVDLANQSASRAFDLSTDTIAGKATHFLAGGPGGIDEAVFSDLKRNGFEYPIAPVISEYVISPELGDLPLQLLGIDSFSEAPFRNYLGGNGSVDIASLTQFLTTTGGILISKNLADRFEISVGDMISLAVGGRVKSAVIVGLLDPIDGLSKRALNGVLLADIATAQELSGKLGVLDKIDLILPENDDAIIDLIQAQIPADVNLLPVDARSGTVAQMTTAFRTNLTALSLLALVVGVFLIYNTMTFSVVQRRSMFGTLRCLGVTQRQLFLLVTGEAFVIGIIGGLLGVLLGVILGRGTVRIITQTINDLFFVLTVQDVPLPWNSLIKGGILSIFTTVLAAIPPAWEAASIAPRAALIRSGFESKVRGVINWVAIAGGLTIILGIGILIIPTRNLVISFTGTFSIIIGFALLTPIVTRASMRIIAPISGKLFGVLGRMAPREVVNSLSRTGIAVAALMIAISVSIGVSLMVGSFRFTVVTWMEQVLQGDVYISSPGASLTQTSQRINYEVIDQLEEWPGVERVNLLRSVSVDSPSGSIQIVANNDSFEGEENLFLSAIGTPKEVMEAFQRGGISISEPLANRLAIKRVGENITLFTKQGPIEFPVISIYYDYSSTQGNIRMWLDTYQEYWEDDAITAISINLASGVNADNLTLSLQEDLISNQELLIRANSELRAETLKVFDRTFAITGALQLLATIVAFTGILSAMLSLQLEKQRQLGILRAIGLTVRQLWQLVLFETGLMGFVAGLLAIPTGFALSLILIYIINRRSFGWTLQTQFTVYPFAEAMLVALLAALLAGIYPAYRLSKRNPSDTIRFE
jgi:putative ABC transport system permease protein